MLINLNTHKHTQTRTHKRTNELVHVSAGSYINDVLEYVQKNGMKLRSNAIVYNALEPLRSDIVLDLRDFGLRLRFDASSQRLKLIDCYDLDKVALSYGGHLVTGSTATPTFELVYKTFGPTYPGAFHPTKPDVFLLEDPGLCLVFPSQVGCQQVRPAM